MSKVQDGYQSPVPGAGHTAKLTSLSSSVAFAAAVALFSTALSFLVVYFYTEQEQLGLVAREPVLHLGEVQQRHQAEVEFTLTNPSWATVTIDGVRKSCSCTCVEVTPEVIHPGKSCVVKTRWSLGASRGTASTSLALSYHDDKGRHGQIGLLVKAEVAPDLKLSAEQFHLKWGANSSDSIRWSDGLLADAKVLHAQCNHPAFRATVNQAEKLVSVSYHASADLKEMVSVDCILSTNSHSEPTIRVPVWLATGGQ